MNITINHYEPDADEPYDVEYFENISNYSYDTNTREIRFTLSTGKVYTAIYHHPLVIDIQAR